MATVAKKKGTNSVFAATRFGVQYQLLKGLAAPTVKELAEILGNLSVQSMPQVAQAFGLSSSTINQSWRANGMPGRSGTYDLIEILAWRLQKDLELADRQTSKPLGSKEKLERELLQIKVKKEEMSLLREQGLLVDRQQVEAEAAAHISVAREALLSIPRAIEVSYGVAAASEVERLIRHQLTALAEKHEREFMGEGAQSC